MKKSLFLVAATASLLLASCSNDELVEVPGQSAIGFDAFVGKTTRAAEATTGNLKSMTVYGYIGDATPAKIFDGTQVTRTEGSTDWTYSPLQYWLPGKNYFFVALSSPVEEGNSHFEYTWAETLPTDVNTFNGTGVIKFNNTPEKSSGNEDFVYASAKETTPDAIAASPGLVQFSFKHALSRIMFTFKNMMGSDAYTLKVYDLFIENTAATGTLVLGAENPVWSEQAGSTKLQLRNNLFSPTTQLAENNAEVKSGTKFIIPGQATLKISFKVDLILKANNTTVETYEHSMKALPETNFENGHSYNFIAQLNPENVNPGATMFPIEFTVVDVVGWTQDPANPTPIPGYPDTTPEP